MDNCCLVVKKKSRAVNQLSCFLFYKNESLSLYEREKKDHQQGLRCCQEQHHKSTTSSWLILCCWKCHFDVEAAEVASLPAAAAAKTLNEQQKHKHTGPTKKNLPEHFDHLKHYFEQLCEDRCVVSVNMLIAELCHHDSKYMSLSLQLLGKQIVRYLEEQSIIYHHVTHVAQNHQYNTAVITDWMGYINEQIVSGRYWASNIMNIEETNIDFDCTHTCMSKPLVFTQMILISTALFC